MKKNRIDLPAAPFRATVVDTILSGAEVVATLMDDSLVQGKLELLDAEKSELAIRPGSGRRQKLLTIAFDNLRCLEFVHRFPATDMPHPIEGRGTVLMPPEIQNFRVQFIDGKTMRGRTRSSLLDSVGLHLFRQEESQEVARLFIPTEVVLDYDISADAATPAKPVHEQKSGINKEIMQNKEQFETLLDRQNIYLSQTAPSHESPVIGQILLNEGLVTEKDLEAALETQKMQPGRKLGEILEDAGAVSERDIHLSLAHKFGIPFVNLHNFDFDPGVIGMIPRDIAEKFTLVPLFMYRDRLVIALDDPLNREAIDTVHFITGHGLEMAIATREDVHWAIAKHFGIEEDISEAVKLEPGNKAPELKERDLKELERLSKEKPIVRLVTNIIMDAIHKRASDIHIRAQDDKVDLLMRVDGKLLKIRSFSKALLPAVVSRIKILGRMDIAERRLPQDGRTRVIENKRVIDLRISIIPTIAGESVVIRLLDTSSGLKTLGEIGFSERDQETFEDLIHKSHGMILVTGPTGCGKSTTLYAALQEIKKQNVNIITVEDPVEYHINGIEQIQVGIAPGYNFAKALRHILRHDPDVIMVGEIRDKETGKMAVESALTGHLVLSTLHTNDAAGAVVRLLEMGVEPYLVSATLLATLAQRLVGRNCPHCITEEEVDPAIRKHLGISEDEVFYHGAGCDYCNDTGYMGRLAVYELLVLSKDILHMVVEGASREQIHEQACKEGMLTFTENALSQARRRVTSLSEVYRIRQE